MPAIMIRCPVHAVTLSTGLSTDTVQFESLPDCAIPMHCPACQTTHFWRPRDAWVFGSAEKSPVRGGKDPARRSPSRHPFDADA
jgi:hypothetical protein